jgi:hypothetical protein
MHMTHTNRYLFVGDWNSHWISVYSLERDWEFVRAIGYKGKGAGQFVFPMGMCVYRDRLIVCDCYNNRLQFIDMSAANAKDWRFDAPFGSRGSAAGQFQWVCDVCESGGVLFVAEGVQTFTIAVDSVTNALTLTHRSFIGGFDRPCALLSSPDDGSRVFVTDEHRIRCIDVSSGAVRSFVGIARVASLSLADGVLYAVHDGGLSIIHVDSGAIQQSAVRTLHGHSWKTARVIAVFPAFLCISVSDPHGLHIIRRSQ